MKKYTTADEIFERTMRKIAPLPCQENYARQLASILSFHVHKNILMDDGISVDDLPSMSALVVAPTGQGKTYLIRKMAEILDLNCIVVDCSTLAAEGWKGVSLGQRLLAAKKDSGLKEEVFAKSLLFLDEVDKIKLWGTRHDQSNPMTNILQLYNAGTVAAEDGRESVNIDIKRFTVLLGGAFDGLDEIVANRLRPRVRIGFSEDNTRQEKQSEAELLQQVTIEDLTKFGMMPELLGRVGTILSIKPMELEDYKQLLSAESGSIQKKYNTYLRNLYGVTFEISDAGTESIAKKCLDSGTGARAVTPLVNNLMRDTLAEVERNRDIRKVILDAGEDGCSIRYEYGDRAYSFHKFKQDPEAPDKKAYPVIWIKARTPDRLAGRLCRFYANACNEDPIDMAILPEFRAFLTCALTYLSQHCRKEDFSFDSLEKLARIVPRDHYEKSTFEIMMEGKMADDPVYKEYLRVYDSKLAGEMVECLNAIIWYICEKRGEVVIRFELK